MEASLRCFERWGIAKTTAEDVARETGISRATVYRLFPGGKNSILEMVGAREISRLLDHIDEILSNADDLETMIVDGIVASCRALRSHQALNYLIEHEPEAVLPFVAFDRLGPALALTSSSCAPVVARYVPLDTAEEIVEWATRMVLSLTFFPGHTDPGDLDSVRSLVQTFLLPGLALSPHSAN